VSELTITATATDASGRVATASVTVDVLGPADTGSEGERM
jgi:hypothetical protein